MTVSEKATKTVAKTLVVVGLANAVKVVMSPLAELFRYPGDSAGSYEEFMYFVSFCHFSPSSNLNRGARTAFLVTPASLQPRASQFLL